MAEHSSASILPLVVQMLAACSSGSGDGSTSDGSGALGTTTGPGVGGADSSTLAGVSGSAAVSTGTAVDVGSGAAGGANSTGTTASTGGAGTMTAVTTGTAGGGGQSGTTTTNAGGGASAAGAGGAASATTAQAGAEGMGAAGATGAASDATNANDSGDEATLDPNTTCTIDVTAQLSDAIATVGILTFSTDLGAVDGGYVEFGLDESYGLRAPIGIGEADYRTVLLGMRQSQDYHYRVVAAAGGSVCASDDAVISTGSAPDGVPQPTLTTPLPDQVTPGFIITSSMNGGGGGGGSAYVVIFDHEGELVWWYPATSGGSSRARMSWDGKFVYARDGNPGGSANSGSAMRVSIDGLVEESVDVPSGHHDMTAVPDGTFLFLTGQGRDGCSKVEKLSTNGELSFIYDMRDAFGDGFQAGNDPCHCNSIHYNTDDDSISVSCLQTNAYVKISAAGELMWVLGGSNSAWSDFTGDIEWNRQHGHHLVTPNKILFFNNSGFGGGAASGSSLIVELDLDLNAMTATRGWTYEGGESSQTLGDAQRLPDGNTLATYSNAGVIHEVNVDQELVQAWEFPGSTGYSNHRPTLYGPPSNH